LARGLLIATICAAVAVCAAAVSADGGRNGVDRAESAARISALTVVEAPTPRFRVPRYDTSGTYPQVLRSGLDLGKVNAALRSAVLADQRAFAPYARRGAIGTAKVYRGVYRTSIDRRLLSASTVVVSALMPAVEQYPGGSLGKTWVAATIDVRSAKRVRITDLVADPPRALKALAAAWNTRFRRAHPGAWACVTKDRRAHRPLARNYQYFALTPRGLAVGFWQEEACDRLLATVPYSTLRPYLSHLGSALVSGVRRPR
jgi:hypothetical protein